LEEVAAGVEAERLLSAAAVLSDGTRVVARVFDPHERGSREASSREAGSREAGTLAHDAESLKKLAHALIAHPRTIALLASRDQDAARLIFARSADAPGDMNTLMREACTLLDGRGGGRPDMAQGGGKNLTQLTEAIERAARSLTTA
jgi:alanyl-tRNA synthetase